jgi:diguanylate cyclase (GGDEF)-like protein
VGKVLGDGASQLPNVFAARYGGEEFALLFSEQSLQSAIEIGDQIRRKIAQSPAAFDGQTIKVTASGGIADWKPGETTASFISRADEALYAAKKSGRNCSCIHELGTIRKYLVLPPPEKAVVRPAAAARTVEIESGDALSKAISRRIAEWRRGGPTLSLIVGRIDNLAALDAQGIQARNLAMQQAADYLKQSLREMDQVALLSGEIFGMLLPNGQLVDAVRIAERMRAGVHQGDLDARLGAHVTISCGVAEVTSDDDGDALVLRARRALEAARRRGGNAVYVNDGVYSTSSQEVLEAAGAST